MKNQVNNIRLDLLCKIHSVENENINVFNRTYKMDFFALTNEEFASTLAWMIMNPMKIGD